MNFSLVFDSTGDSIPFQTISNDTAEVLCYFVENLNNQKLNKFSMSSKKSEKINNAINKLHSSLVECNSYIYELLDQYVTTYTADEYLNQDILNKLHADWVNSQGTQYNIIEKRKKYNYSVQSETIHNMFPDDIPVASVGNILNKLGFRESHDQINLHIHELEDLLVHFRGHIVDVSWFQIDNPFSKNLLTDSRSNFLLPFHHLGRTLYNKFVQYDYNLEYNDENSSNELLGFVQVSLHPAETISLSPEYINWCTTHNKVPSGTNLNIGNIPDLHKKLTTYRTIMFKNTLQNNTFSIQLNKGN